ncbi:MAG: PHP domain-containing protein [Dehalococcoidia bacterium]|nr:PHP domain-containing protein [Dehalococcoidia bacterium]
MIKIDLHIHTTYSNDSEISPAQLIARAQEVGLGAVAVVDHNTAEGSLKVASMSPPFKVITGEEILTPEGEIIGLFLKETITPGASPEETIRLIHAQGGLACVPHPFDRYRSSAMQRITLERIAHLLDIVEVANSRTLPFQDLSRPEQFATKHTKPMGAGSDAHNPAEVGLAYVETADFDNSEEFLKALSQGHIHYYKASTGAMAGRMARKLIGKH